MMGNDMEKPFPGGPSPTSSMATDDDDWKKKNSKETLKLGFRRDYLISKRAKRKSLINSFSNCNDHDLILHSLNVIDRTPSLAPSSMCKCPSSDLESPASPKCGYCLSIEVDPTKVLPKWLALTICRHCGTYFSRCGRTSCRVSPQSPELLNFLVKELEHWFVKNKLALLGAQFVYTDALSKRVKINLNLQMVNRTGEKVDINCSTEFLINGQKCLTCMLKDVPFKQFSVVQLKPYGTSNNRQSLLNLEELIVNHRQTFRLVDHEKYDTTIDLFFREERDAMFFVACIRNLTPIKSSKFPRILGTQRSRMGKCLRSCHRLLVSPLRYKDLVFLPSKVSAKVGNMGPLVICTKVSSFIRLLDPFKVMVCSLSAHQYWNAPFEPIKTREQLVEFIVLNVEVVSKGPNFTSADIEVARVSDFGKNDVIFLVRSHLAEILKPGDYAFGYVLNWENINHAEAEKRKGSLPEVVLVRKKSSEDEESMRVDKKITKKKKNISPEYMEFLSNLEKNPEAMFNLSLKCEDDDEKRTLEMLKGKNVDLNLEDMLADLGLSDEEDGSLNWKE